MANKLTIEIVVSDNGTAKIVQKGIEGVGKAAEGTTKKTRDASKAQDELNYKLNQGATGVSSAARSFSKLNQAIGQGPNGLVGAYATLAANAFALSAAFNQLKSAATVTQLMQGLDAQGARMGKTLSLTAQNIQEVTKGAIGMADAMRATAQATAAGFNSNDIARMADVANNASKALGRDLSDSLDRVIKGVGKLEPELLDELGITTKLGDASAVYALKIGKTVDSLTSYEKKQAFLNAVLAEGELKFGGLADSIDTNVYEQIGATFDNLKQTVLEFINGASPLLSIFTGQTGLAGGVLLFASTIKNQLLPGLAQMSKATGEETKKRKEFLEEELTTITKVTTGKRKETNAYIEALKKGTDTGKQYSAAIEEIQSNRKKLTGQTDAASVSEQILSGLTQKQVDRVNKLAEQERTLNEVAGERNKISAQSAELTALEATENMNLFNVGGSLKEAFTGVGTIWKENKAGLEKVGTSTTGFLGKIKLLGAAGPGIFRVVGSAAMGLIPIFGEIMIAIQAVGTAFSWLEKQFRPQAYFDLKKVSGELDEIFNKSSDRAKEMSRLLEPNINAAEAQAKQFELMSNSIVENIDKLNEYYDLKKKLDESGGIVNPFKFDPEDAQSSLNQMNEAMYKSISDAQKKFRQEHPILSAGEAAAVSGAGISIDQTSIQADAVKNLKEYQSLANVIQSSTPPMQKTILNFIKTLDFSQDHIGETRGKILTFLNSLKDQVQGLGMAARAVQDAFKKVGDSTTKFLQATKISTKFDDMVDSFDQSYISMRQLNLELEKFNNFQQQYNSGIENQESNMANAAQTAQELGIALSGISQETRGWLKPETLQRLKDFESSNADLIQKTKEYKDLMTAGVSAEAKVAKDKKSEVDAASSKVLSQLALLVGIQTELDSTRDLILKNQELARIASGRLKVEQARQSTITAIYEGSSAGEAARLANEQKIRDLNLTQLDLQKQLIQEQVNYSNAQIKDQEGVVARAKIAEDNAKGAYDRAVKARADAKQKSSEEIKNLDEAVTTAQNAYLQAKTATAQANIQASQLQIASRSIAQSLISINYERSAILVLNLNKATEEARKLKVDMAEVNKAFELISKRLEQRKDIEGFTAIFEQIFGGSSYAGVARAIEGINKNYNNQKKLLQDQLQIKLKTLGVEVEEIKSLERLTNLEEVARHTKIAGQQAEINNEIVLTQTELDKLELQRKADILAKSWVDTRKEGLEYQKEAISYLQKEVQSGNELLAARSNTASINDKLLRQRRGLSETSYSQTADEIKAATLKYQLALNEAASRMAVIDLEFALLKGQKALLEAQLTEKRQALLSDPSLGITEGSAVIKQIDAALALSSKVSNETIDKAAQNAKETIIEGVKAAKGEVELARARRIPTMTGPAAEFASKIQGILETSQADREAQKTLAAGVETEKNLTTAIKTNTEVQTSVPKAIRDAIGDATNRANQPLVLVDKIKEILLSIDSNLAEFLNKQSYIEKQLAIPSKGDLALTSGGTLDIGRIGTKTTSGYGYRKDPMTGKKKFHPSVDRAGELGSPVEALMGGTVTKTALGNTGYGNYVTIEKNIEGLGKVVLQLSHLASIAVRETQQVTSKDIIGTMGSSGKSTGPHTDLKLTVNGETKDIRSFTFPKESLEPAGAAAGTAMVNAAKPTLEQLFDEMFKNRLPAAVSSTEPKAPVTATETITPKVPTTVPGAPTTPGPAAGPMSPADTGPGPTPPAKQPAPGPDPKEMADKIAAFEGFKASVEATNAALSQLGPGGQVAAAVGQGMLSVTNAIQSGAEAFKNAKDSGDKFIAGAAIATAALQAINSIIQASSNAAIASIDKQIAAEQKRDGKSKESVDKINAMEKKKDDIARKAFNTNKKIQMATAIINTAAGVVAALKLGPPAGPILAGIIGAMGMAQIAIISGTQYESSYSPKSVTTPSNLSIGKRSDSVNLAGGPNANAGGEVGYLRGAAGTGTNASNYRTVGSAYGGEMMRGYGNRGFVVGEKGPEVINPETPISVTPANDVNSAQPINANISIQALDGADVKRVLVDNRGNIIQMLREAANNSGQRFLEDVNVNVYTRPNIGKL